MPSEVFPAKRRPVRAAEGALPRVRRLHSDPGFVTAWPDKSPGAQFPFCKMSWLDQADISDT